MNKLPPSRVIAAPRRTISGVSEIQEERPGGRWHRHGLDAAHRPGVRIDRHADPAAGGQRDAAAQSQRQRLHGLDRPMQGEPEQRQADVQPAVRDGGVQDVGLGQFQPGGRPAVRAEQDGVGAGPRCGILLLRCSEIAERMAPGAANAPGQIGPVVEIRWPCCRDGKGEAAPVPGEPVEGDRGERIGQTVGNGRVRPARRRRLGHGGLSIFRCAAG